MNTAFTLYPPTTTPGSTPSSSVVNINDVGQLSAELHVPHLSEHDAISARATVSQVWLWIMQTSIFIAVVRLVPAVL